MATAADAIFACAGAAGLSLGLTPLFGWAAKAFGFVDVPNVRKVHRAPIPRTGGLAIGIATLAALMVAAVVHSRQPPPPSWLDDSAEWAKLIPLLIGGASVLVVGVIDDLAEIRTTYKLMALVAAALAFCATGGSIHHVVINGHKLFDFGIAAWPVTILWIVTVTVAINFIDGLDGLAAGIVAAAAAVLAVGAAYGGSVPAALVGMVLCASLAGFLVYNYHPASIFMGDGGSLFIGFTLAAGCALANEHVGSTRALLLPTIALAVPLLDTALTMVRRGVLQRRSLFAAERGHVHHRLMDVGLSHLHAVIFLHAVTLAGAAVGLVGIFAGGVPALAMAVVFGTGLVVLFRTAGSVRARDTVLAVRRNRAIGRENRRYLTAYYDLQLRFRESRTVDGWWEQLCRAADVLDFAKVDVPLTRRDGSPRVLKWRRGGTDGGATEAVADHNSITAEVPIPQRRTNSALRARVEVSGNEFLESAGHRLALFSRLMAEFGFDQLRRPPGPTIPAASAADAIVPVEPEGLRATTTGPFAGLRVALVHDFLYTYAGAERVLEQMVEVFPEADVFALFDFLPADGRAFIRNKPVTTSFLQRMPFARTRHRAYLPLMPMAVEQLDVSAYDIVLSSSYVAAKGVLTRPGQLHVCYCHTPVRFAWDLQGQYLNQTNMNRGVRSVVARTILHYIRSWDLRSAQGVDVFLTNSDFVGRRIRKLYRRTSTTVYPPVDTEAFLLHEPKDDFYLTASRMVPYKRIDLIVEAFAAMPTRKLLVVGEGPELARIQAKAGPNVTFAGHEPADRLRRHMQTAKAFVFAAEEDFGIAPVEAMACGTPVIGYGRGGVTETVVDGQTGVLFAEQTVAAITKAVERFESQSWDAPAIRRHAERFSVPRFRQGLTDHVLSAWQAFQASGPDRDLTAGRISTAKAQDGLPETGMAAAGNGRS